MPYHPNRERMILELRQSVIESEARIEGYRQGISENQGWLDGELQSIRQDEQRIATLQAFQDAPEEDA